ncbi:MAG: SusD/RagB family nutrient-binding outer membrane lipoprotein [Bacteroidetes bacterium]|nr:SusD/RagB family nutrient-binding outer membrane lipoprotein [Bacteroidota bacterium]
MKNYVIIFIFLFVILAGCEKAEYFQENPNGANKGIPSLFLTELEKNLFNGMASFDPATASRYEVGFSYHGEFTQYYKWTTGSMDEYLQIKNASEMIRNAGENQSYIAIGKLFTAINFYWLTNKFGDIPCSEAFKLEEGIDKPVYDSQEKVYEVILTHLKEANELLASSTNKIEGDFIYNGNLIKWRKFVNSFKMRVLLSLSRKNSNASINPKALFNEMLADPAKYPLFSGNEDNAQRITNTVVPHPFYNDQAIISYHGMEKAFVDSLKLRKDPRLFHYAEITDSAKKAGMSVYDYKSYRGLPGSAPNEENTANMLKASIPNRNYFKLENYEPLLFMGYYELNFLVAEGIARGWSSAGNAETYYNQGIRASMNFYGIHQDTISRYLNEPKVKFDGTSGLSQILFQKYIGGFYNSGWEPFYSQRRTGIPVFDVSGNGVPNHQVATRWKSSRS